MQKASVEEFQPLTVLFLSLSSENRNKIDSVLVWVKLVRSFTNDRSPVAWRKKQEMEMEEGAASIKKFFRESYIVSKTEVYNRNILETYPNDFLIDALIKKGVENFFGFNYTLT